ncbi:MAG TPA: hypothetical protein VFR34_14685, partial [Paracoccaceae bacterium]|nr:hypothetical protein [Paracoccaceae bacterium]
MSAEFLPLIFASPAGQSYAGLTGDRALAVGAPAPLCPALAPAPGADVAGAVTAALGSCRRQLELARAPADCGCRLIAVNGRLLAPTESFAYATGLSARIIQNGRLDPVRYVAEERLASNGETDTVIRAGEIPVWLVRDLSPLAAELVPLAPDGTVTGPALAARRQLVG